MHKIRWGILGVAKINNRLLPSFRRIQYGELRAIASRDADKAKQAAQAAQIPVAYGSYEALLNDSQIDAVYIPLPNTLHNEWTRKAADAGKHVLCEKPLTPTAAEAESLIAYCQSKDVKLMDGFMWPHHPRTHQIRKLLDAGTIGSIRHVTGTFTFQLPLDRQNIRLEPEMAGGSLLDVGCYPVYGIRWAFGAEPLRVCAQARWFKGVDLEMSAILEFADGRLASFDCGFTAPMRQWLEIVGESGVIRVPKMWVPEQCATFTIERDDQPPEVYTCEPADQIAHMLDDFATAILKAQPVYPDPRQAYHTARVMDALLRSARQGGWQQVS
ncbi:MAG: Gfo/Idh/MocA family oxidoreductase [Gemmataceae bacterium]